MEDFLKFVITPLLSQPDKLELHSQPGSLTLHVSPEDMGRVIGKHGVIISALRTLLRTYCAIHQLPPVTLTLAEN